VVSFTPQPLQPRGKYSTEQEAGKCYRRFGGFCCSILPALLVEATVSSETLMLFYQTTRCHAPQDNLHTPWEPLTLQTFVCEHPLLHYAARTSLLPFACFVVVVFRFREPFKCQTEVKGKLDCSYTDICVSHNSASSWFSIVTIFIFT
jgi:hypothetical protein